MKNNYKFLHTLHTLTYYLSDIQRFYFVYAAIIIVYEQPFIPVFSPNIACYCLHGGAEALAYSRDVARRQRRHLP